MFVQNDKHFHMDHALKQLAVNQQALFFCTQPNPRIWRSKVWIKGPVSQRIQCYRSAGVWHSMKTNCSFENMLVHLFGLWDGRILRRWRCNKQVCRGNNITRLLTNCWCHSETERNFSVVFFSPDSALNPGRKLPASDTFVYTKSEFLKRWNNRGYKTLPKKNIHSKVLEVNVHSAYLIYSNLRLSSNEFPVGTSPPLLGSSLYSQLF